MRDWYWQVQALRQGPDAVFSATVLTPSADLASLVRRHMPPSFLPRPNKGPPMGPPGAEAVYVDRHTHDRMQSAQDLGIVENIWYHGSIAVHGPHLWMENALLCHYPGQTELLVALMNVPGLSMAQWRVAYAGDSEGEVAAGHGNATLMQYLMHDA